MKKRTRSLLAGILVLVMLCCIPGSLALAQQASSGGLKGAAAKRARSAIGTVIITKKGYLNARQSPTDKKTIFRVHYGERYLCVSQTEDGWYEIMLPTEGTAFIPSDAASTTLLLGEKQEVTLSILTGSFDIRADKKVEMYSQPKTSAKMRRVSSDGSTETTYYYSKNTHLTALGSTTRDGKTWYLILANTNGVTEPAWVLAENCTVMSGAVSGFVIPETWYD